MSVLLFAFYPSVKAQNPLIPFSGEREVINLAEIKTKSSNLIKGSRRCGDYFLYRASKNSRGNVSKEILTFRVSLPKRKNETNDIQAVSKKLLAFKSEEQKRKPTAEWDLSDKDKPQMIIRISSKDFEAAPCLLKSPITIIPTEINIDRYRN